MQKRDLKYIVVENETKTMFDKLTSQVMMVTDRGLRVTQDYVIRLAISALAEKLEHAALEQAQK